VGIGPNDIIEKKEELVLSVIWQVLRVHLMRSTGLAPGRKRSQQTRPSPDRRWPCGVRAGERERQA